MSGRLCRPLFAIMYKMLRTRDFLLVLVSVVFLVIAIAATLLSRGAEAPGTETVTFTDVVATTSYSAQLDTTDEGLNRAQRLAEMRAKIAASGLVTITEPVEPEEPTGMPTNSPAEVVEAGEELRCPGYAPYFASWPATEIEVAVTEGVRRYYVQQSMSEAVGSSTGSTSAQVATQTLAQIPARPTMNAFPQCLESDVIGIAIDGSLIRNNEASLYAIFSENTLIGYALDGYPIYGLSDKTTDVCGEISAAEGYRYQLSQSRDVIINCFIGTPATLP